MNRNKKIKDILNDFINIWAAKREIYLKLGIASDINLSDKSFTFQPSDGGPSIDCTMQAAGGLYLEPVDGSPVLIGFTDKSEAYCLFTQNIENAYLDTSSQFIIDGGSNGGLVKISDLVDKLNTLEQDINDLKTAFSTWAPASGDGGAALKLAAATWYGSQLDLTTINDLENDKIIH